MRAIASVLIVTLFAIPAFAADDAGGQQRGKVREACKADIASLCANVETGGGKVRECLRANKDKLSEGCKSAIEAARQARENRKASEATPMRPTTTP